MNLVVDLFANEKGVIICTFFRKTKVQLMSDAINKFPLGECYVNASNTARSIHWLVGNNNENPDVFNVFVFISSLIHNQRS